MIFRNSKVIKYSILYILLFFNIYGVSNSTNTEINLNEKKYTVEKKKKQQVVKYSTDATANVTKKLDSVFKRLNKRQDFHGSVLVAKNGKIVFANEYGYANFRDKKKIDKYSTFQLASVSKQFTAAAILMLNEDGLLTLNDKVIQYFPEFPYEEITIKQLLNHTSGLPKYFWLAEHKWNKESPPDNLEMMDLIAEYKLPLFFKPGRNFDYSNTGYFVLASLVERISGKEFGNFIETKIFKPLEMNNSFVYRYEKDSINDEQLDGYRVYRGWRHGKITGTVNDAITGDKNVYSTTEDLFKWIMGLNSGKIISKSSLEKMYTQGQTKYGRKIPYGFGFRIVNENSEKVIYHNGKWNGFSTSIKQYTDSDLVIITLEHSNYKWMNILNKKVKKIVENNFDVAEL
ncbi:MAG: beta-lactamase family protein [Flavobacteriaceae bacterium]|nr:beta-lactamase family protein [Flavobacteriaceae bacterium]